MKTSLRPTKVAWKEFGAKCVKRFPHYQQRLPELAKLYGEYPIVRSELPSWWQYLIVELSNRGFGQSLIDFFKGVTLEEFVRGQFDQRRHKELKAHLLETDRKRFGSPSIGRFLVEEFGVLHQFTVFFNDRGSKASEKEIVITGNPLDIVTMSTRGKSWTSCQNFQNSWMSDCVWANLCDPGMAIVFVRTRDDRSDKDMDTRVILRFFRTYHTPGNPPRNGVVLDRFYGDVGYVEAVRKLVKDLCRQNDLCLFEYCFYNASKSCADIKAMASGNDILTVRGCSVNFHDAPRPYMDNAKWVEEKKNRGFHRLEAQVRVVHF